MGWAKLVVLILAVTYLTSSDARFIPITLVADAVAKGAVCMDGSPPAYHFDPGFETGVDNWLIHVEGGAWCESPEACLAKRDMRLGSSTKMTVNYTFSGILSFDKKYNPDFYNWNRVKIRYCDGSSFTGDVEAVDPTTKIYYRGNRAWNAIMDELMAKGMKNAKTALLAGCSAGGLSVILHCDSFHDRLPTANVKCFSDAGYFINGTDVNGGKHIEEMFAGVVATHGSVKNLPASCTAKFPPVLDGVPIWQAVGDWFFERNNTPRVEKCAYPCDKSIVLKRLIK